MESQIGDTYLILRGPDGEEVARDDDGGAGLNSRIEDVELPSTGQYTIVATSFWENSQFPYQLSLSSEATGDASPSGNADADLTVAPVQASPGGTVDVTYELVNTGEETRGYVIRSGLRELPEDWEISERADDGGTWQSSDLTWLFQELGSGSSAAPTATIEVPDDAETGTEVEFRASAVTEQGTATATGTIEVRETTLAEAVDQNDDGEIGDLEILDAIEWWQNDEEVPGYGNTVSDLQILELIGMWQDGEEV